MNLTQIVQIMREQNIAPEIINRRSTLVYHTKRLGVPVYKDKNNITSIDDEHVPLLINKIKNIYANKSGDSYAPTKGRPFNSKSAAIYALEKESDNVNNEVEFIYNKQTLKGSIIGIGTHSVLFKVKNYDYEYCDVPKASVKTNNETLLNLINNS